MEKIKEKDKIYVTYLKSIIGAGTLSVVLLILASLLFYFTDFSESQMSTTVWVITVLGICYAGVFSAMKIGTKGYLHGAILGAIYTAFLGIIGVLTESGSVNIQTFLVTFIMSLLVGMFSGMIGVIIKK